MDIEERITRLEDIESIRNLQARYQRCLDTRDFDGLSDCFAPDAVSSYDGGKMRYEGRESILDFLRSVMTADMPSAHLIHGGEIDVKDSRHAVAKWYLEDHLLHRKFPVKLNGAAIYDVEYLKDGGRWTILRIGYTRCYQYFELRGPVNLITLGKTRFLDALKKKKR